MPLTARLAALGAATLLLLPSIPAQMSDLPPLPEPLREFRGVWVATVWNIDWPPSRGMTTEQQRESLREIIARAAAMKMNAIAFQVRSGCDAMYASEIEPWSYFLTGEEGQPPSPWWDPLEFAVEEAHRRGMELHAWFNPYRVRAGSHGNAPTHISQTHPELVISYGDGLVLNPAEPAAQEHTLNVILDVVERYDVDGVHFDDYFYPYPVSNTPFPDAAQYAAYQAAGGTLSLGDWRRSNVNEFIEWVSDEIHALKPHVRFGIGPFGIWRPGNPPGIQGLDAYESLAADSRLWLREGWVDYLSPQLYWRIDQTAQSFPALLDWWIAENVLGRHIWPGLNASRLTQQGSQEAWPSEEIVDQIELTQGREGSTGHILFSERALASDWGGIQQALLAGPYQRRALPPRTPWLDDVPPSQVVSLEARAGEPAGDPEMQATMIGWRPPADGEPVRSYVVQLLIEGTWLTHIIATEGIVPSHPRFQFTHPAVPTHIAVRAMDGQGNLSDAAIVAVEGGPALPR